MASSNYPQGSKENPHSLSSYDYLLNMNEWNGGWVEESSLNKYYIDGHNFAHKTQGSSLVFRNPKQPKTTRNNQT